MWPHLVPPSVCCTPCVVVLTGDAGENGVPQELARLELHCNWQDRPRQELDAQRRLIRLEGKALFDGDIAPEQDTLCGRVELYGKSWRIYRGSKCRNPDGSVNFTQLEVY